MVFFFESIKNRRNRNEDSYCHMDLRLNHEATVSAFAVADGMGGLSGGSRYSKDAVSLWYEGLLHVLMSDDFKGCSLKNQTETLREFSVNIFTKINDVLYQNGMNIGVKGGTTLTTAIHFWDMWIFANLGDSPAYLIRNGEISLCSDIQNMAWQLVKEDKTNVGSTLFYQNKNRLLEYLGRREKVHPHCVMMDDKGIDTVILGSDGAYGNLSMEQVGEILIRHQGTSDALTRLLEAARDQGETDNQTAILINMSEEKTAGIEEEVDEKCTEFVETRSMAQAAPVFRQCEEESLRERFKNYLRKRRSES